MHSTVWIEVLNDNKNATIVPEHHSPCFLQAGRSTYVAVEILSSVPDPGAVAAASWYRAAALVVKQKS